MAIIGMSYGSKRNIGEGKIETPTIWRLVAVFNHSHKTGEPPTLLDVVRIIVGSPIFIIPAWLAFKWRGNNESALVYANQ
jgi:hypothetical protein